MPILRILMTAALIAAIASGCTQPQELNDSMPDSVKLEALDINIERNPDDHELLAARARVLLNLGRVNEAAADIDKALRLAPETVEYLLLKADICFRNGDVKGSYNALEQAEALNPESQEVQLKLGEITYYNHDYDRAMAHLTKVTEKDANNRTALFMKGFIYKEKGDTANAVQLFRRVCDKFPDYAPSFEQLGVLYAELGDNMALEYLGTALQLEPNNTNVMYALALFYQDHDDMEKAESLYRQILDLKPESADAWHNMGWIELFFYHNLDRAIEFFTKAIEANSGYIEAYANRGIAYENKGDRQKAKADFEAALSLNAAYQPAVEGMKRVK
jgi:tetratricopeptide (TPR) repeat protein